MYSEFDRHPVDKTRQRFAVGFVSSFPQEESGTVNRSIWTDALVSDKSSRCTTCFQQPAQPPSLIRARSRCNKMAFMSLLTFVVTTLLVTPFILWEIAILSKEYFGGPFADIVNAVIVSCTR